MLTVRHPALFPERLSWSLVGWKKRKKGEKNNNLFHPAPRQPLDVHVEVLMGVRCAPNQRNMAGNVSEPKQGEKWDYRNCDKTQTTVTNYTS